MLASLHRSRAIFACAIVPCDGGAGVLLLVDSAGAWAVGLESDAQPALCPVATYGGELPIDAGAVAHLSSVRPDSQSSSLVFFRFYSGAACVASVQSPDAGAPAVSFGPLASALAPASLDQVEGQCFSAPHVAGEGVLQASCTKAGWIDCVSVSIEAQGTSSSDRAPSALRAAPALCSVPWPTAVGKHSARGDVVTEVLALEFLPIPGGVDLLGNALLCALHRDHIPAANARVVHLSCVAFRLDGSDARLEKGPWSVKNLHPMACQLVRVDAGDAALSGVAVLDPTGVTFLAQEGPKWRATVPDGFPPLSTLAAPGVAPSSAALVALTPSPGHALILDVATGKVTGKVTAQADPTGKEKTPREGRSGPGPSAVASERAAAQGGPREEALCAPLGSRASVLWQGSKMAAGAAAARTTAPGNAWLAVLSPSGVLRLSLLSTEALRSGSAIVAHACVVPLDHQLRAWPRCLRFLPCEGPAEGAGAMRWAAGTLAGGRVAVAGGSEEDAGVWVGSVGVAMQEEAGSQALDTGRRVSGAFAVPVHGTEGACACLISDAVSNATSLALLSGRAGSWQDVTAACRGAFYHDAETIFAGPVHDEAAVQVTADGAAVFRLRGRPDGAQVDAESIGRWRPPNTGRVVTAFAVGSRVLLATADALHMLDLRRASPGASVFAPVSTWRMAGTQVACCTCGTGGSAQAAPLVALCTWGASEAPELLLGQWGSSQPFISIALGHACPARSLVLAGATQKGEGATWCVLGMADGTLAAARVTDVSGAHGVGLRGAKAARGAGRSGAHASVAQETLSWERLRLGDTSVSVTLLPDAPDASPSLLAVGDRVVRLCIGPTHIDATPVVAEAPRDGLGLAFVLPVAACHGGASGGGSERGDTGVASALGTWAEADAGVGPSWRCLFGDRDGVIRDGWVRGTVAPRLHRCLPGDEVTAMVDLGSTGMLAVIARDPASGCQDLVLLDPASLFVAARLHLSPEHHAVALCAFRSRSRDDNGAGQEATSSDGTLGNGREMLALCSCVESPGNGTFSVQDHRQLPHDLGVLSIIEARREAIRGQPRDSMTLLLHASLPLPAPPTAVLAVEIASEDSRVEVPGDAAGVTGVGVTSETRQGLGVPPGAPARGRGGAAPAASSAHPSATRGRDEATPADATLLVACGPDVHLVALRVDAEGRRASAAVQAATEALAATAEGAGDPSSLDAALQEAMQGTAEGDGGSGQVPHAATAPPVVAAGVASAPLHQRVVAEATCCLRAPGGGAVTSLAAAAGTPHRVCCSGPFQPPFVVECRDLGARPILAMAACVPEAAADAGIAVADLGPATSNGDLGPAGAQSTRNGAGAPQHIDAAGAGSCAGAGPWSWVVCGADSVWAASVDPGPGSSAVSDALAFMSDAAESGMLPVLMEDTGPEGLAALSGLVSGSRRGAGQAPRVARLTMTTAVESNGGSGAAATGGVVAPVRHGRVLVVTRDGSLGEMDRGP